MKLVSGRIRAAASSIHCVRIAAVALLAAASAVAAAQVGAAAGLPRSLSAQNEPAGAPVPSAATGEPIRLNGSAPGVAPEAAPKPAVAGQGAAPADPAAAQRPESPARPAPPVQPLTDFQRFVQESSGQTLPLYGYNLFRSSAFPSLTNVPVPADYVLGPGDEIVLRLWGSVEADLRLIVDRNGQVALPRVGTVTVAGLRASQLQETLRAQVAKVFRNFEIDATLGQLRAIQIFVVGQAAQPGAYTVSSLSTLLSALFEIGGPAPNGTMRGIQLRRDGRLLATMDLYRFIAEGDKSADVRLLPGDVIVIPPAGPRVALLGSVDTPAVYELLDAQEPLSRVLGYAGQLRALTATHKVLLERIDPAQPKAPRMVEERALDDLGLRRPLRDGDVVTLFRISPRFANAVTLRGNVAAPLRYAHAPGMRISDLIPERDALIQPDYYLRKNKLVQYERGQDISLERAASDVKNLLSEINWDYAVVERLNRQELRAQLVPFNLGKAVLDRDPAHDLLLEPGDVVTVFSVQDIPVPRERSTRLVRVGGEVQVAGVYQIGPDETLRSVLRRAGGLTPQAYVFGTEFSRESTRVKQREALATAIRRLESSLASAAAQQTANLSTTDAASAQRLMISQQEAQQAQLDRLRSVEPNGRIALELNPGSAGIDDLPDLPLEDGDRILVPARPGFVHAVGAVANDNALLWREDRTVDQYLMAAGLDRFADEDNIFVLRADGSITHRRDAGYFFSSFGSMSLAPGDTLVVPELLNRESAWSTFVRGLKDWTQIIYQFGLSAAIFNTLK